MYVCERKGRQKINSDFCCCSERGTMTWRKRRANNWESTHIFFQNEKIGKRRKKLEKSINPTGFRRKKWKKNVREKKKSDKGRNDRSFFVRKSRTICVGRSWAIRRHKDERNLMENLCQLGAIHLQAAPTHRQATPVQQHGSQGVQQHLGSPSRVLTRHWGAVGLPVRRWLARLPGR